MSKNSEEKLRKNYEKARKELAENLGKDFLNKALKMVDDREKAKKSLSGKDERISFLLKKLGYTTDEFIELFGLLSGKDLSFVESSNTGKLFEFIVPLSNTNGHNYPLNISTMSLGYNYQCMKSDGSIGNQMSTNYINCIAWRYSTKEEIKNFLSSASPLFFERISSLRMSSECERKNLINVWRDCVGSGLPGLPIRYNK